MFVNVINTANGSDTMIWFITAAGTWWSLAANSIKTHAAFTSIGSNVNRKRQQATHCDEQIQTNYQLESLRWFSQRRSQMPHFWGCAPRGLRPPNSNSAEIFVQCTYPQISSSYVYSFGSYRVDKQTHPQKNKQRNRRRWKHPRLRRWVITLKCAFVKYSINYRPTRKEVTVNVHCMRDMALDTPETLISIGQWCCPYLVMYKRRQPVTHT